MSLRLPAGVRVRDPQAARPWYELLLGEPTFFPHVTEAVWTLAEGRSVYVVEHADGAGNSVVTIFVDDLDAHVAAIAARGLESDERLTYIRSRSERSRPSFTSSAPGHARAIGGIRRIARGPPRVHERENTRQHAANRPQL